MIDGKSEDMDSRRRVHLPAEVFRHLRWAVREEAGPSGVKNALHTAGFALGGTLFADFSRESETSPASLSQDAFWRKIDEFFGTQGWGRISQERVHPGLGMLRAEDWAESRPGSVESEPSCAFTAGLLAQFLSGVAGGPISVLEVSCSGRGDSECGFLFGSERAIQGISGILSEGLPLSTALARL